MKVDLAILQSKKVGNILLFLFYIKKFITFLDFKIKLGYTNKA